MNIFYSNKGYKLYKEKGFKITPSEILLAGVLRRHKIDFEIQAGIDLCTVDILIPRYFYPAKIIIEVDGSYHADDLQKHLDKKRMCYHAMKGYYTIRITNEEIDSNIDRVIHLITGWGNLFQKLESMPPVNDSRGICDIGVNPFENTTSFFEQ